MRAHALYPGQNVQSDRGVPACSEAKDGAALPDHIYMDAMGFGMGCSCLQITFQSCNVAEARRLYDALVPVAPLMVRLLLICICDVRRGD